MGERGVGLALWLIWPTLWNEFDIPGLNQFSTAMKRVKIYKLQQPSSEDIIEAKSLFWCTRMRFSSGIKLLLFYVVWNTQIFNILNYTGSQLKPH